MIYFDNSASTPLCEKAKKAVIDEMELYANPSSLHRIGFEAELRLKEWRKIIAKTLFCRDEEIFFTSGGTEADNLAILGVARALKRRGNRIITSDSEHPGVSEPIAALEKEGFEIIRLSTKNGRLSEEEIENAANENTILTAVMHTNNETGAVYDIKTLSRIVKGKSPNALVFSDCVQAYLKQKLSPCEIGADIISISSHKIHGPKGVGALFVKKGVRISPLIYGGGQEKALRSGTENMPGIAGFAAAALEGFSILDESVSHIKAVRDYITETLSPVKGISFNIPENPAPNIISMQVAGFKSEVLLHTLSDRGIFVSSGSACSSKKGKSGVLKAFGLSDAEADRTIRISLSRFNTVKEADFFCEQIKQLLNK